MNSTSVFKSNWCCKSFTLYWKRFNCIPYRTCCYFSGPPSTRGAVKMSYYNCVLKLVILFWISKVLLYILISWLFYLYRMSLQQVWTLWPSDRCGTVWPAPSGRDSQWSWLHTGTVHPDYKILAKYSKCIKYLRKLP